MWQVPPFILNNDRVHTFSIGWCRWSKVVKEEPYFQYIYTLCTIRDLYSGIIFSRFTILHVCHKPDMVNTERCTANIHKIDTIFLHYIVWILFDARLWTDCWRFLVNNNVGFLYNVISLMSIKHRPNTHINMNYFIKCARKCSKLLCNCIIFFEWNTTEKYFINRNHWSTGKAATNISIN